MGLIKGMLLFVVAFVLVLAEVEAVVAINDRNQIALDGCQSECYGVQVPYPFGIGKSTVTGNTCFLEKPFELTCNNPSTSLIWGFNIPVIGINITQGQVDVLIRVSKLCYDSSLGNSRTSSKPHTITSKHFTISSKDNKFITVGCDTFSYLDSFYNNTGYSTGCLTRCYGNTMEIKDGDCSGIGCCQVDIPPEMNNVSTKVFTFENFNRSLSFNNCSYSFVVKNGNYTFSKDHLENLPYEKLPVVFDWSAGNETCEESLSNACKGNSHCVNSTNTTTTGYGYRCQCNQGFEGNPYLHGCTDIDECNTGLHTCKTDYNCRNTIGSYECFCPKGQSGNGTKEDGCHKKDFLLQIVIGGSAGSIAIFVGTSLLYLTYQKRKLMKLKEKFFKQNGGLLLLQQLSTREDSSHTTQIFTSDELIKATNNYDENLIVGRGGYGTVYKGVLENDTVVAIKKSKIVDDPDQVQQFINEVIVLSQIKHRNVVKLLGCCLETEVPLLVYEFVRNGTLFDFIHDENKRKRFDWENRLRIATEAAGALSYLHSSASIPIVHRDVKSANILLDEDYIAKVSDFGASRFVPRDENALATMVQGTIGYLDPEYMQSSQLTEKSDVYSFGVVLAELLTGKKPFSFEKYSEKKTNLAAYLLSCLKEDCLVEALEVGMLNEENKQEIVEVAVVAAKCLRVRGEERPSMKEVAMELEGIRLMSKHHWVNNNGEKNFEETQYLLPESSWSETYEHGDSSSSSHQNNTKYDSIIRDQEVLIVLENGR